MHYKVLTFGSAVVDKILCVDDAFLEKMGFEKGGTRVHLNIDHEYILDQLSPKNKISIAGGGAANTTKVLAGLGIDCAYIAKIGRDKWGEFYRQNCESKNILPLFSICDELPTGSLLCLITPDGERTMCPDLRACQHIGPEDLKDEYFLNSPLFHLDGYNLHYKEAMKAALERALKHNCPICIDFSSFELIRSNKSWVDEMLAQKIFKLIFANEREAYELTGESDPIKACQALSRHCSTATVMMGERGSVSFSEGQWHHKLTKPIKPLDTTGAGDMFIGGFLYGYLNDLPMSECLGLGNTIAAEGIQIFGGELPQKYLKQLSKSLNETIKSAVIN